MWYFAWILGLPLAALFAVLNAMWLELREDSRIMREAEEADRTPTHPAPG
ncbi:cytochrome bd-I oxidase subunit CydX [Pararhodobacter sp. CCB-MM2]|nr:cytochrome bd-I oxidase subunit CydX [Pararhodobacter sp. CCB-MM2]